VGQHVDLVHPVKGETLTEDGRSFARAHHDLPVP
jgi:hypothetical protein